MSKFSEFRSFKRTIKYIELKYKIEINDHLGMLLMFEGEKLRAESIDNGNKDYTEKEKLAIAFSSMYDLNLEFYDYLDEKYPGKKFYQFDKEIFEK